MVKHLYTKIVHIINTMNSLAKEKKIYFSFMKVLFESVCFGSFKIGKL